MSKIRDSELASVLRDAQLRSLGFVLNARGRWLRTHALSRREPGKPLSPRPAGATKRTQRRHKSATPPVGSRGSSASGSRASASASHHRHRGGPGCNERMTSNSNDSKSLGHTSPRSGLDRRVSSTSPYRQHQAPLHSTSRGPLGAVACAPPSAQPVEAADGAAAPGRLSLHRRHVPPIPVDASTQGIGGWPRSGQTPSRSSSPVTGPRSLPVVNAPSLADPPSSHQFPWSRLSVQSHQKWAVGDTYEGHSPSTEQGGWDDVTTGLRGGMSATSVTSTSSVSNVVSRLSYDDQLTLHEGLPWIFPCPQASSLSPTPSPRPMPNSEPLAHLPTEIRLQIVEELGPAEQLALRRAFPAGFGFIYGEDARYQRLWILERLAARKAESNLWWAEAAGDASPESQATDRKRLEQLFRCIRPQKEPLLRYAVARGYPADDINALVEAYQERNIDLVYELGIEGFGAGRRGRLSGPRSC